MVTRAIYKPRARAILLAVGDDTIELSVARIGEFVRFLRAWPLSPRSAAIAITNDSGRVAIRGADADDVANAIVAALDTPRLARDLPEAA